MVSISNLNNKYIPMTPEQKSRLTSAIFGLQENLIQFGRMLNESESKPKVDIIEKPKVNIPAMETDGTGYNFINSKNL